MRTGVIAGNFDVIHPGYIRAFKECRSKCDRFIILLHEDPSIERLHKLSPILSVEERREILLGIRYVDGVATYKTEKGLRDLLILIHPEVRFLGADYIGKRYTGDDLSIPIHWLKRDHGWSTTKFKQMIANTI
jgi:glycerol-3-phosphate cytidylyltransferase